MMMTMNKMDSKRFLVTFLLCATFYNGAHGSSGEFDTIVVGMGAAGTVAASTLARAGKKVLALEAQDRIGGRVYTVPFGDGFVEVGAEWMHGTKDSRTYHTALENNITVLPQQMEMEILKSDGNLAGQKINELLEKVFSYADENSDTLSDSDKPEGMGDYLTRKLMDNMKEKTPDLLEDKDLVTQIIASLRLMIEGYEAANDWNDISVNTTFVALEGHQHMSWHRNGYKTFFELLLNKYKNGTGLPSLNIKLKTEVTKIQWPQQSDGKVSVTAKDGTVYEADNVIVTTSLGVLKHKYKTLFAPSLPQDKIRAIDSIQIGVIGKIILSFPEAWWPSNKTFYGFLWKTDDLKNVVAEDQWTTKISGASIPMASSNTITLWTAGETTKQVEVMSEDVVKTKTVGILRRFMGANTTIPEPIGIIRTEWFVNEFTRGAYTYDSTMAADVPTARSDLASPLKDSAGKPRVLFAGEASHPTRFSTVHGAADTGHREAMRLLNADKP